MLYNPDCILCDNHKNSKNPCMYGQGPTNPKLMFIAESVDKMEDDSGRLLQGKPGKTLDIILDHLELTRDDVYITNAVKCRPFNDGKPTQKEIKTCKLYLEDEIERIKPEVIITLGAVPLKALLGLSGVDKNRRKEFEYKGIKVFATYNPSICFYKGPAFANEIADDIKFALGDITEENIPFTFIKKIKWSEWLTPLMCLDIETNEDDKGGFYDTFDDDFEIECMSVTNERNEVVYLEGQDNCVAFANRLLEKGEGKITVVGHNNKYDFKALRKAGLDQIRFINMKIFDTLTALSHIDENYPNKSLEHSCQMWCGVPAWKHLYDTDRKTYNALDVVNNMSLAKTIIPELNRQQVTKIFMQDMETLKALTEIELNGMKVHQVRLKNLSVRYLKEIKRLEKMIPVDNPNSGQQIADLIYNKHRLPIPDEAYIDKKTHKTKKSIVNAKAKKKPWKKNLSTAREILLEILKDVEDDETRNLIATIVRYKSLVNTRNTFITGWRSRIRSDGCLHQTYTLAKSELGDKDSEGGTVTGRLGCKDPNLMNIPREKQTMEEEMEDNLKKYGFEFISTSIPHDWNVKRCIISRFKGGLIRQDDADQAEMRGFANFSGDPILIAIFMDGIDIHQGAAAEAFKIKLEEVTKFQRKAAKTLNFGVIYLSGVQTMAVKMDVTRQEMQGFMDNYAKRFKVGWKWRDTEAGKIIKNGNARNVFGRIRHLPGASQATPMGRAKIREGVNFLVQGPVAELTKYVMTKITFALIKGGFKSCVIGNIHDAIVTDIHPKEKEEVSQVIDKFTKKGHVILSKYPVPFVFTSEIGPNLMETKEIEEEQNNG